MIDLKNKKHLLLVRKEKSIIEEELLRVGIKDEDIEMTKELIEEEQAFRRGVLSVRDLISPASFKVSSTYVKLGQSFSNYLCY